ncbi:DUF898 family protein [Jannaschia aquimarina]|uniref:Inner membrane protein YjgN n=1 Tax=Jannaschia aquimarina TaxID=935700 RepID=A0A0D1EQR7_9RHOB|nr:DUF898 family protein [Jannaschia aquimarina]KIT17985.1 hypothetical protein jaqu_02120 [Jannaschia aquimarina]SNS87986.1 Uncharacterized membrane protein YjgN, DUF898 family [Jannaschia aquimarina]
MQTSHGYLTAEVDAPQSALFSLVMRTGLLTVGTLGLYSFWMRTRTRRWLWSSLKMGGSPFEYDGRPVEKLIGFVMAAVIVSVWLGLVMMGLVWLSLVVFLQPAPGFFAALALVLPIYWFAQYRGMRYLMGHTTWRGIRFWMVPGALGYIGLSLVWSLAIVLSAGLAIPAAARARWAYRIRRMRWGDATFTFEAGLGGLYRAFLPVIGLVLSSVAIIAYVSIVGERAMGHLLWLLLTLPGLAFAWIWWRVRSFGIFVSGVRLGEVRIEASPNVGTVLGIYLLGLLFIGFILGAIIVAFAMASVGAVIADLEDLFEGWDDVSPWVYGVGVILFYLLVFILRGALRLVFVTYPLLRHVAETATIRRGHDLYGVGAGQGARMADADGFSNLFDMGAGI